MIMNKEMEPWTNVKSMVIVSHFYLKSCIFCEKQKSKYKSLRELDVKFHLSTLFETLANQTQKKFLLLFGSLFNISITPLLIKWTLTPNMNL